MKTAGSLSKESGSLLWLSPEFDYDGKDPEDEVCDHRFYVKTSSGEVRQLVDFEATRAAARKEFKALVRFTNGEADVSNNEEFLEVHQSGNLLLVLDGVPLDEDSDDEEEEPDSDIDEDSDSDDDEAPMKQSEDLPPSMSSAGAPMEDADEPMPNEYAARLYQRFGGGGVCCIEVLETTKSIILGSYKRLASFVNGIKIQAGSSIVPRSVAGSRATTTAAPTEASAAAAAASSSAT